MVNLSLEPLSTVMSTRVFSQCLDRRRRITRRPTTSPTSKSMQLSTVTRMATFAEDFFDDDSVVFVVLSRSAIDTLVVVVLDVRVVVTADEEEREGEEVLVLVLVVRGVV